MIFLFEKCYPEMVGFRFSIKKLKCDSPLPLRVAASGFLGNSCNFDWRGAHCEIYLKSTGYLKTAVHLNFQFYLPALMRLGSLTYTRFAMMCLLICLRKECDFGIVFSWNASRVQFSYWCRSRERVFFDFVGENNLSRYSAGVLCIFAK